MIDANLNLALTVGCQLSCVYCNCRYLNEATSHKMSLRAARRVIESFRDDGFNALSFFGGEPTLHPHLADCIRWARQLGYEEIALTSNGLRLKDAGLTRDLVSSGLTRCSITLCSQTPEIEDAISGEPGTHKKKLSGLMTVLAAVSKVSRPPSVCVNILLAKPTLPGLPATLRWLNSLGVNEFQLDFIWPMAQIVRDRDFVPRYKEAASVLIGVLRWAEAIPSIQLRCTGFPPCMLRWAEGKRPSADMARLRDRYLVESACHSVIVWPNEAQIDWMAWYRTMKTQGPACLTCPWLRSCFGVWKPYSRLYGLRELPSVNGGTSSRPLGRS